MKKGVKLGIGIGCGALVLIGVAVLVGGYFALNYFEENIAGNVRQYETEGREFAAKADQQGCMKEGVRRSESVGPVDFSDALALTAFVDSCLKASKPTQNFCEGVPSFWSMQDNEWIVAECRKAGADPEKTACVHVFKRKHQFCSRS